MNDQRVLAGGAIGDHQHMRACERINMFAAIKRRRTAHASTAKELVGFMSHRIRSSYLWVCAAGRPCFAQTLLGSGDQHTQSASQPFAPFASLSPANTTEMPAKRARNCTPSQRNREAARSRLTGNLRRPILQILVIIRAFMMRFGLTLLVFLASACPFARAQFPIALRRTAPLDVPAQILTLGDGRAQLILNGNTDVRTAYSFLLDSAAPSLGQAQVRSSFANTFQRSDSVLQAATRGGGTLSIYKNPVCSSTNFNTAQSPRSLRTIALSPTGELVQQSNVIGRCRNEFIRIGETIYEFSLTYPDRAIRPLGGSYQAVPICSLTSPCGVGPFLGTATAGYALRSQNQQISLVRFTPNGQVTGVVPIVAAGPISAWEPFGSASVQSDGQTIQVSFLTRNDIDGPKYVFTAIREADLTQTAYGEITVFNTATRLVPVRERDWLAFEEENGERMLRVLRANTLPQAADDVEPQVIARLSLSNGEFFSAVSSATNGDMIIRTQNGGMTHRWLRDDGSQVLTNAGWDAAAFDQTGLLYVSERIMLAGQGRTRFSVLDQNANLRGQPQFLADVLMSTERAALIRNADDAVINFQQYPTMTSGSRSTQVVRHSKRGQNTL
jgi:hypothetical protein